MRAGGLRVRVEIWGRLKTGVNDYNSAIEEDAKWKTTAARMVQRRGNEREQDGRIINEGNYYFHFRYYSVENIRADMWIMHKGQKYEIININPDLSFKRECVVEARILNINF